MSRRTTWNLLGGAVADTMWRTMEKLTDTQLRSFIRGYRRSPPTSTNCGWLTYRVAPWLLELAENERLLWRNKRKRERDAQKAALHHH